MIYRDILRRASEMLLNLKGKYVDVLEINQPPDIEYAKNLVKVVSKLSPLMGNMIEFSAVSTLNKLDWQDLGK